MLGISYWDWAALLLYFGLTVFVGVWAARRVHDTTDFFMAGRRFGKPFMIFFAFGAGTSGNDAVGVSSKTFTNGLSGIWYQWLWLFCTPFYWLIAPIMRRMRAITTGDYFEYRYDGSVAGLYTLVGVIQLTVNIGVIQLGAGSMIEGITGGAVSRQAAIIAMTVMFVIYGVAGGLAAAIVTDFIQGILTVILSFILLPFALDAVGGFAGLHQAIEQEYPQRAMFSLVAPGEINLFWVVMLGLNALIGIVTQPHIMGVCAAGRTEMDGRVGFAGGNLIKRLCTVAWMIVGLCGVVMYLNTDIDPDTIYGQVASDLLPGVLPGLIGLFLAALIASVMSSCDAFMVSSSGLFTQNFYRRWIVPDKTEAHYVWVGRVAALFIVGGGITFAFLVRDVPSGLVWFFKLQALMGAAFWIGLVWRRATIAGAWAATLAAFAILFFTSLPQFHDWAAGAHTVAEGETWESVAVQNDVLVGELKASNDAEANALLEPGQRIAVTEPGLPPYMIWNHRFRDSWQIFFYLLAGFGVGILVSLVTPRVAQAKLDRFYRCIRTPVMHSEPHSPEPFMLPEGLETPEVRKLIPHPDFELYRPSAIAVNGFLLFWFFVAILVGFVYWMATWGAT